MEGGASFRRREKMKLITWTSVLLQSGKFPREKGKPFLPGKELREALKDALVYYSLKKNKSLERRIKSFLRSVPKISLGKIIRVVEDTALDEARSFIEKLRIPEKIFLEESDVKRKKVEVYDLKREKKITGFEAEAFEGIVDFEIELNEKLKSALHSYCEALAHAELTLVRGHPLEELFYRELTGVIKGWDYPLRLGFWTTAPFGGRLFWFWGDKELRHKIRRTYGLDVRPSKVLYFPHENKTAGWTEVRQDA